MKKAAVGAQGELLRTKSAQRFRTWEAIVVNDFPVMLHGGFGLKLICSVTEEAELRGRAITK